MCSKAKTREENGKSRCQTGGYRPHVAEPFGPGYVLGSSSTRRDATLLFFFGNALTPFPLIGIMLQALYNTKRAGTEQSVQLHSKIWGSIGCGHAQELLKL